MPLGVIPFQGRGRFRQTDSFHPPEIETSMLATFLPRRPTVLVLAVAALILLVGVAGADEPTPVEITSPLPYGPAPINYFAESTDDAIARLQQRLDEQALMFEHRRDSGYLLDLLRALEVPVESQTLVFSKTSLNQPLIKPSSPRAIYFNDDVTIGWVPGSAAIEVTLQDDQKGTVFYTLPQRTAAGDTRQSFVEIPAAPRAMSRRRRSTSPATSSVRS